MNPNPNPRTCTRTIGAFTALLFAAAAAGAAPTYEFGVVHTFSGVDGSCPNSTLVKAADGAWYGTTLAGGPRPGAAGTVFRLTPKGRLQTLRTFMPGQDGGAPAGVVLATDGNLYGIAMGDWMTNTPGFAYRLTPAGEFSVIHAFEVGDNPQPLIQGRDGALYGTTADRGAFWGGGSIYRMTLSGDMTTLHLLGTEYTDPWHTVGALAEGETGTFYGATNAGGAWGQGAVYRIGSDGTFAVLHSFPSNGTDGQQPRSGPAVSRDGTVAGTTAYATPYASGTVYTFDASGTYGVAHTFATDDSEGKWPAGGVAFGPDGGIYGTTSVSLENGVQDGPGTVWRIKGGALSVLHTFAPDRSEGASPATAPLMLKNGDLLGVTCSGGAHEAGTIYRLHRVR